MAKAKAGKTVKTAKAAPQPAAKPAKRAKKSASKPAKPTAKRTAKKTAAAKAPGMITVRQVRSEIGTNQRHREVLRGLGLRGISHSVERQDSGAVRGMIAKIPHLVRVEETA